MISPASSIIPVNICGDHQVGSDRCSRHIVEFQGVGKPIEAVSTDDRCFASAENPRGRKGHYFINDAGLECVKSQVRAAFQHEALNLPAVEVVHQSSEAGAKNHEIGCVIDSQPAVEYDPKKRPSPGSAGPVREPRVVTHKRSASGNDGVHAMP